MLTPSETRAPEARERPIIFSAPMVRAILAGRKTQTRRVLRWQPDPVEGYHSGPHKTADGVWGQTIWEPGGVEQFCPLRLPAAVGERLWVREAWCPDAEARDETLYRADGVHVVLDDGDGFTATNKDGSERSPWRSPIHMPRSRSRLTLEVTEVRVERLASISREDAIAEGATSRPRCYGCHGLDDGWSMDWSRVGQPSRWAADGRTLSERDIALWSPQDAFGSFINELHDPRWNHKGDGIFGENPWVAAITFRSTPASLESQKEGAARG